MILNPDQLLCTAIDEPISSSRTTYHSCVRTMLCFEMINVIAKYSCT